MFLRVDMYYSLVQRGQMHVLSAAQFAKLLKVEPTEKVTQINLIESISWLWIFFVIHQADFIDAQLGTLLDIGAGDGNVTARLEPLFQVCAWYALSYTKYSHYNGIFHLDLLLQNITATEVSPVMRWRLQQRGFKYDICQIVEDEDEEEG